MRNSYLTKTLSLITMTLLTFAPTAMAATNQTNLTSATPFLQAQVSKQDTMSRAELDSNQANISPFVPTDAQLATASMQARQAMINGAAAKNQTAMLSGGAQNQNLSGTANNQPLESDLSTDVRTREYNVDWAGWISRFADRWFFVLKQCEMSQNAHFVTVRPALFQFTCYNNGTVANVVLKQSSGNVAYDRLQVIALMQAMPAPPFPAGTHRQTITLVQGWESHVRQAGESDFIPGSFGRGFPMEKVKEWVQTN